MVDPILNTTAGVRTCLRCSKKFKSKGPGNRICNSCSQCKTRGKDAQRDPKLNMRTKNDVNQGGQGE